MNVRLSSLFEKKTIVFSPSFRLKRLTLCHFVEAYKIKSA